LKLTSLISEEERIVSTFPSNALSPGAQSPVVMVTQPQASPQPEMMTVQQQNTNQTAFPLSPQPQQQSYQGPQVHNCFDNERFGLL